MKTKDARSLTGAAQEELRFRAVKAVDEGKKQVEVAKLFVVTRQAVGRWVKAYRNGGEKALTAKKQGRPKGGTLFPWQAAQIAKTIKDRHPDQLKLPFYLWTREAVAKLIEKRFGIRLSRWTVGRYLARWNFTPQKPLRQAFEQKGEEVRQWLEEKYPLIRKEARKEEATIHWADETGLRSDHAVGRSYAPRGQTPVIQGTGKRFRCNMVSTITNQGCLNFMVFQREFNAEVFMEFLRRLTKQSDRKVFLIIDKHPVHRSKKIKKWVQKNSDNIRIFFLPGYSPELNPDELVNQDVKSNALGRSRPRNRDHLINSVRSFLWSRQRCPQIVKRYFHEKNVCYAAT